MDDLEAAALKKRVSDLEELVDDLGEVLRKFAKTSLALHLPKAEAGPTALGMAQKHLTAELTKRFESVMGRPYQHQGPVDAMAVKRLLATLGPHPTADLLTKWEECLKMKGYPGTHSIAQFVQRVNSFGKSAGVVAPAPKGDLYGA